jgi:hypothetical protein
METVEMFVPIQRVIAESNGSLYTFGVIPFDEPDTFNTVLTRELVESNLERLHKYPALRFMHHDPLGIIDFEHEILDPETGQVCKTEICQNGFAVLGKVDDACVKERSLIQNGHFGYSYGYQPEPKAQPVRRSVKDGVMRTHFVSGILAEISVVDIPANWTAATKSFVRIIQSDNVTQNPQNEGIILEQKDLDQVNSLIQASETRIIAAVKAVAPTISEEQIKRITEPIHTDMETVTRKIEAIPAEHSPANNQTITRTQPVGTRGMIEAAYNQGGQ